MVDGCTECGDPVRARGLCGKHYNRLHRKGAFRMEAKDLHEVEPQQIRDLLAERICPLCESGPFVHPLAHVAAAHGVSARDVKLRAGVNLNEAFWSDVLASTLSARSREQDHALAVTVLNRHRSAAMRASRERSLRNPTQKQAAHASAFALLAGISSDELSRLLELIRSGRNASDDD